MTDDILIRRTADASAAADNSHGAEWDARTLPRRSTRWVPT